MTIKERKELEKNGIFLNHWYQVELRAIERTNSARQVEYSEDTSYFSLNSMSFPDFDSAYECYKKHKHAHLKEIEVWEYNGKQEVVSLLWNESKQRLEVK